MFSISFLLLSLVCVHAHPNFLPPTVPLEGAYYTVSLNVPEGCPLGNPDDPEFLPVHKVETIVPGEIASQFAVPEWMPGWPATVQDSGSGDQSKKVTWTASRDEYVLPVDMYINFGLALYIPPMDETGMDAFSFPTWLYCKTSDDREVVVGVRLEGGPKVIDNKYFTNYMPVIEYKDPCDVCAHHGADSPMPAEVAEPAAAPVDGGYGDLEEEPTDEMHMEEPMAAAPEPATPAEADLEAEDEGEGDDNSVESEAEAEAESESEGS